MDKTKHTPNCPAELQSMPPESSFQSNLLQDTKIPQEAKDKFSSLLEGVYDGNFIKITNWVRRTDLFQVDIPTAGPSIPCKQYPILLKYQMFIDKVMWLLENAKYISKSLIPWAVPIIIVPRKPDP